MKKRLSALYHHLLLLFGTLVLITLGVTASVSYYLRYQKGKLNKLALQKVHTTEQEIFLIKNRISKFKEDLDQNPQKTLGEENLLSQIDFENEIRKGLAQFKHQTFIKKISLPSDTFPTLEQKYFLTKITEKKFQLKQKQWILIKFIFENILVIPKLKIGKFELQDTSNNDALSNSTPFLGELSIDLTTREEYFQKLFNTLTSSKYFFVISSARISNSNPLPPLHHYLHSKDCLLPILGNETITIALKIKLFDATDSPPVNKVEWIRQINQPPLFVSRHYATKNEILIDPIEQHEALAPPAPNEWLVYNNLDYSNPNILFEDIDRTGFNNLEKWQGDNPRQEPGKFPSDPNDPTSHPLLWTKLRCYQKEITTEISSVYFLGLQPDKKGNLFEIQPNIALEAKNHHGRTVFNKAIRHIQIGEQIEGLPYKAVHYQEKKSRYRNICYDSSELTLEHLETKQQTVLIKKTPYHPQPTQLINVTSIKIQNAIFNPPQVIDLKLGDHFSLDYFLPNEGLRNKEPAIEREDYQLIDINDRNLTIRKDSNQYKIPIIPTEN